MIDEKKIEWRFDTFAWRRPANRRRGFEWSGEVLRKVQGAAFEEYKPDVALFRNFAALSEPDAILRFANTFGLLTTADIDMQLSSWQAHVKQIHDYFFLAIDYGQSRPRFLGLTHPLMGKFPLQFEPRSERTILDTDTKHYSSPSRLNCISDSANK